MMKKIRQAACLLLCLALCLSAFPAAPAEQAEAPAPTVRVLLRRLALTDRIDLTLSGAFTAAWGKDGRMRIPDGSRVTVQIRNGRLVLFHAGAALDCGEALDLAREGRTMDEIREHIVSNYYPLDFTLGEIRMTYRFDVSCQGSVPQAIEAFLESTDYEDAIRNAISIGGDSDTIAAMAGGIAEAFWGIPDGIRNECLPFLDESLVRTVRDFEARFGHR